MKFKYQYLVLVAIMWLATSCKKDTYDAPKITLKGRLVYNGESINLEYNQVPLELYQPGFGKTGAITATFAQDGTYSMLLFSGDYKLIIPNGQGPFRWSENATTNRRDTMNVSINGDQTLDLNVTPYYLISNPQMAVSNRVVTATFGINKVITDANARNIERVTLYVNKTQFVSGGSDYSIVATDLAGSAISNLNSVSMSATVPAIAPTQNYAFARIGLKVQGIEDMIFSPVQKIQL
ncbi:DUF3823 domain-containing protein [Mucilaginibacter sp. Bleaf8]|uniref:DUF3823 domain-containing protein n=1 Tax=Mucilaginibacter sp. Bleaf8 TaxID=2834430 RepID=UPI001BCB5365|nr:DUF3823 domain-containing protein [Mucilaginibacter sp. Bleaf8]MBS7562795.1 DUF3823 domain-containing protein [Mucilaginibacter sp. Bleaf8]